MKRSRLTLLVFILMNFVVTMSGTVFNGILDKVALSLNVSVARAGLLNTMFSYGAALGVPLLLIMLRNTERVRMLKALLGLSILATLGLLLARSFGQMLVIRLLMGILINSYGAVAMAMAVALAPPERQGRALALYITGASLSVLVGVPLTRQLSGLLDWRGVFWLLGAVMALSLVHYHVALPRRTGRPPRLELGHELQYLRDGKTRLILVFTLLMFTGSGAMAVYMTPYLLTLFPSLEGVMSLVLVLVGLASMLGNALGGWVSDRIGYARSMLLGGGMQLVTALMLLTLQGEALLSVLFTVLWMMSVWFTGLQVNAGVVRETGNQSSFMLSLNGSAVQMGYAVGSSIAALIISGAGISRIILITITTACLICLLQLWSLRRYSAEGGKDGARH